MRAVQRSAVQSSAVQFSVVLGGVVHDSILEVSVLQCTVKFGRAGHGWAIQAVQCKIDRYSTML